MHLAARLCITITVAIAALVLGPLCIGSADRIDDVDNRLTYGFESWNDLETACDVIAARQGDKFYFEHPTLQGDAGLMKMNGYLFFATSFACFVLSCVTCFQAQQQLQSRYQPLSTDVEMP